MPVDSPFALGQIARSKSRLTETIPLPPSPRSFTKHLRARFHREWGSKAFGIALAILLEGLLLLALLSLGWQVPSLEKPVVALSTFTVDADRAEDTSNAPDTSPSSREKPTQSKPQQSPPHNTVPASQTALSTPPSPTPALIPLTRDQMVAADIFRLPAKPAIPTNDVAIGPTDIGRPKDTPLMGARGPRGEKLYAASWYREPYDDELRGYLSTAQGPGWGLIACKTVADFRVDDCAIIDEYPKGSNIARSVLAASWQFRVRPPRLGGRAMIGEWVGIRIDYNR